MVQHHYHSLIVQTENSAGDKGKALSGELAELGAEAEQLVGNIGVEVAELGGGKLEVEALDLRLDARDLCIEANAEAQAGVDAEIVAVGRLSLGRRLRGIFRR
jgi:hypothetical protein